MTSSSTLTAQEKIEYLATKVMGWIDHRLPDGKLDFFQDAINGDKEYYAWNPLTDWNHWRQVELKLMEDGMLLATYFSRLLSEKDNVIRIQPQRAGKVYSMLQGIIKADLPTRVSSLIQAHKELYATK